MSNGGENMECVKGLQKQLCIFGKKKSFIRELSEKGVTVNGSKTTKKSIKITIAWQQESFM